MLPLKTGENRKSRETRGEIMPRQARLKPKDVDTVYHICNRVAGDPEDLPFRDPEKKKMVDLIQWLGNYYAIDILSFAILSNHFHIFVATNASVPSNQEAARRYAAFYGGKRELDPTSERCTEIAKRLADISWFTGDFEQRFSAWYNRTRVRRRRGGLWAGRFRSCIVEQGVSTWRCLTYIEMNPVRANMAREPADYRFSSWGIWNRTGRHPFAEDVNRRLQKDAQVLPWFKDIAALGAGLREALGPVKTGDNAGTTKAEDLRPPDNIRLQANLTRRCSYWSSGCVVGDEAFVQDTVASGWGKQAVENRRLKPADDSDNSIFAYRSPRNNST
jgi:hypothetical protein